LLYTLEINRKTHRAKIPKEEYHEIRELRKTLTVKEIAEKYGVSKMTIYRILQN